MCLAIPMRIVAMDADGTAVGELEGVRYPVSVRYLKGAAVGDFVIVHAGHAIERLSPAEAQTQLDLLRAAAQLGAERPSGGES